MEAHAGDSLGRGFGLEHVSQALRYVFFFFFFFHFLEQT